MDMRKKISGFFLIGCLFLITSAFTWPWEKEKEPVMDEPPRAEEQVELKRGEAVMTPIPPAAISRPVKLSPMGEKMSEIERMTAAPAALTASRPEVLSTQPSVVRDELNRVMQANKIRQAQLEQQMEQVKEVRERTGIYNRMLATVATRKPRSVSAQAVSQERVRVLHEQIRSLSVAQTGKIPALESAAQAKDVAAQASQSD